MTNPVITLIAFGILVIAVVIIFFVASRRIFSFEDNIRASLAQQLPMADVNYLLSTNSVDTNSVESLIYLANRIRTIRSPILKNKSIRNIDLWIVVNLIISEQRIFQQRTRTAFRLFAACLVVSVFISVGLGIANLTR